MKYFLKNDLFKADIAVLTCYHISNCLADKFVILVKIPAKVRKFTCIQCPSECLALEKNIPHSMYVYIN